MTSTLLFRGTRMTIRLTTAETGGVYALIEMEHPPLVGPALHIHPRGPESFYVLAGEYTFTRGDETIVAGPGDAVTVPAGVPHRYVVGAAGGRALVIVPPGLEAYFERVGARLVEGQLSFEEEAAIASECGQDFLDHASHWGRT
ncbi:MAG: cupin domain-containing protein [Gemmatimonadota bacterium]